MIMRNPVTWRWSHTRHHTDTIIVGRDPEIAAMRPPDLFAVVLNFFGIIDAWHAHDRHGRVNATGRLSPTRKRPSCRSRSSQGDPHCPHLDLAIYAATFALALYFGSLLPLMISVGLPAMYGAWHHVMTGLLQHGGLAENVIDHRLNSAARST